MTRVSPRLLLASGAVLLAAWVGAPLSSSPPPQTVLTVAATESQAVAVPVELDEINTEIDRLRDRPVEPVRAPEPVRDPFQFAPSRVSSRVAPPVPPQSPVEVVAPGRSAIRWPSLVAILASGSESSPTRRAVLEDAAELVQFRSEGEALGDIVVTTIDAERVTLTHTPSGETTHLALR